MTLAVPTVTWSLVWYGVKVLCDAEGGGVVLIPDLYILVPSQNTLY